MFALVAHIWAAPQPTHADAALANYFSNETAAVTARCLAGIKTLEDWRANRAEYRRQLLEMLGLWPMPERTDLKPVVTGRIEQDEMTLEKVSFQALPGLYCTANLFVPKNLTQPAPTILYECGHARFVTNGISYGNKAFYQFNGAWFARNGYVCLVLDTLQAGEIQGIHAGTRDRGLWWWNSRGYTPAGVEAWFGIRALDYLCSRPEVDTNRIGITGHSGGGVYSWMVTALDDRIRAAAPLAGMADLQSHIGDAVVDRHCDCNFLINIYRWDFPQVAALAAPRPLLIGSTDNDRIYPLHSTIRIYEKVRAIYKLHNATDNLGLALVPGPHDEVPELRLAALRWFDRHLAGIAKEGEQAMVVETKKFFTPEQVRVFTNLPADAINANIAETFVPKAKNMQRRAETSPDELRATLRAKVFAGWPADDPPLEPKLAFSVESNDVRLSAWDFPSQHDVVLRLYLLESAGPNPADTVTLRVLDAVGWTNWLQTMRLTFTNGLTEELAAAGLSEKQVGQPPESSPDKVGNSQNSFLRVDKNVALAFVAPRGVGLTAWSGDEKALTKIRRRFMLLGQTLDGMRVWDIRRAIGALQSIPETKKSKIELRAHGLMAVNALYAALFEPAVRRLELTGLPQSHMVGPDYLGVLKITDIPEVTAAVGRQAELKIQTQ